ncbi:MAG: hypothetical protein WC548_02095 [Candidatus Pacearchaeota archaeon]
MTQIISPALEIMVVDDEVDWRNDIEADLKYKGYNPFSLTNSFQAIEEVTRRLCNGRKLPFVYLSDILDMNQDRIAGVIEDRCGEFKTVYRNMALDLYQFLKRRGMSSHLIACTCHISPEDREIAKRFGFPLITKSPEDFDKYFPDIKDCKTHEESAKRFSENYKKVTKRDK